MSEYERVKWLETRFGTGKCRKIKCVSFATSLRRDSGSINSSLVIFRLS